MTPFLARLKTCETGAGCVGYLLAKGDADGSWRITDKEWNDHDLVGSCDTPEAMIPCLIDHLEAWKKRQREAVKRNMDLIDRSQPPRGARPTWKAREKVMEREALKRAERSADRVLAAVASVARHHGWPVAPYAGPWVDLVVPGVLEVKGAA